MRMRHLAQLAAAVALLLATLGEIVAAQALPPQRFQRAATTPSKNAKETADTLGTRGGRSTRLPLVEAVGFLAALNIYDRFAFPNELYEGKNAFSSTFSSTWKHLREQRWVHDPDPFNVNQFAHPYLGATLFGISRSTGHGFWTSLLYADVGSFTWEMAGELTPPSVNDLITTGQAGTLLGESLYRIADLVLKDDGARWWHPYLAGLISPPTAVNRRVLGKDFKAELPDSAPSTAWEVRLGARGDAVARDYSSPVALLRRDATAEFSASYGLPGRAGYDYSRPLDYFTVEASFLLNSINPIENVMLRGLLVGRPTRPTANSRGIWGLYGSYDYISPYLFRISSTALSLGTTRQYRLSPDLALQGSLLGGVGYGAAGSEAGIVTTSAAEAERDYHLGITPQTLGALRVIFGDRAMVDMTARGYYVSGVGSDDSHGSETIFRGNFGASVRVVGGHTLGVRYVASTRDASYGKLPDNHFSEGAVAVVYSFLGANHFRAVQW